MHKNHQAGVIALVLAAVLGHWTYDRYYSLVGQVTSWSLPLSPFQTYTVVGGLIGVFFLVVGLRLTAFKPEDVAKKEE